MVKANKILIGMILAGIAFSCNEKKIGNKTMLFETLDEQYTGLKFMNKLTPTSQFNMFNYMYFYNGAGIGAGDFNNDGLIDLFFASNQERNTLYLNKGNLTFTDVTVEARIPDDKGWSTGISIVDINNDSLPDIYVCRVGKYEILNSHNQFLVCKGIDNNGVPYYEDMAKQYGVDFSGFSSQALFFDYDLDEDLDLFLLNHSIHQNGVFAPRNNFLGTYDSLSGDRIFRNDGAIFTDVTKQSGINSSAISYGLGIASADINHDGWPDIYAGNDFHENDYLYINQKNGSFTEEATQRLMHTSKFSMGVDIADVNNDGYPEIISMDMLPSDPHILKRSLGDDEYDISFQKIDAGYSYQYSRNNLQFNRGNGLFSEIGTYSGVQATDWSWSPLFMDFDNDGLKDLFISNGIPKRLNDMDYINFISSVEIQEKIRRNELEEKNLALTKRLPEIKIPNKFFINKGDLKFTDIDQEIANNKPSYSNGAVYADFDNDGDLDIVVNNIDNPVTMYKNTSNDKGERPGISVRLVGSAKNINAVGAKVLQFTGSSIRLYENNPVKGFLSSMQTPLHIGLYNMMTDSAFLIWPDNTYQRISFDSLSGQPVKYKTGLPVFSYSVIEKFKGENKITAEDITATANLRYQHRENSFVEFNRETLIPHMISAEGPALAIGDINNDGLDDIFIGSSKGFHNAVFIQSKNGKFEKTDQPDLYSDSLYEDVDATWIDVNNDKHQDLVVASGGNEYFGTDSHLLPRIYINDGYHRLKKLENAITGIYVTTSCIAPYDFNEDGYIDLFVGGRAVPWSYGETPRSYLLQNDGTGKFIDVTSTYTKDLEKPGMVTNAVWYDIDKDNDKDLLLCYEWGGVDAFMNSRRSFAKRSITDKKGWWNFILPFDADNDGDIDLLAGNLGLNSRLQANEQQPVRMYFDDFDDNGKIDQVISYYIGGREIPFATKEELVKQLPDLKKRFFYAQDFANSTLEEIFTKEKLSKAEKKEANFFANTIFINQGDLNYKPVPLPWEAQLTTYRDAVVVNVNDDNLPDILLAGNYYENNIQLGRYDADYGTVLVNKGNDLFACETISGITIKGQVRRVKEITIGRRKAVVLARNNDSTLLLQFKRRDKRS